MNFNQFAEITGYFIFFIIVLYVTFILVRFTKTREEKNETEKKQFNKSILFLLLGGVAGFLLSIAALNITVGKISSEEEVGIWYLTILVSTVIVSLSGFAISGKNKKKNIPTSKLSGQRETRRP